jgi:beta-glucanase (GH16 family)
MPHNAAFGRFVERCTRWLGAAISAAASVDVRCALVGCALVACGLVDVVHGQPAAPVGWTQVWNDEFEGGTLDAAKWQPETTTNPANNERQAYIPQQVSVSGGNMVITSENVPYGGKSYRSGRVHSVYTQRHGRWEIRADLPTSRGMWPAIWLLPDGNWPSQGEIDIMENRGTQTGLTSSAYHFGTNPPYFHDYRYGEQTTAKFGVSQNYHTGFHTYAVEWDAKKLRFFVDDVHYLTLFDSDMGGYLGRQTAQMRTILNTAVGGDFLGALQPNNTTVWPQQFLIDYVRVFNKNNDVIRLRNGDFDENGGSLTGWTTFGNRLNTNNVSVHNEAVDTGPASLKVFGQATGNTNYSGVSQGITVAAGQEVRATAESFIRSQDSLAGTGNTVQMKIEFYNDFGGKYGTSDLLQETAITIADAMSPNNAWRPHELSAVAPAGAVEARLAFVFSQPAAGGSGAVHIDDVAFRNLALPDVADANGDGNVDGFDLLKWQRQLGTTSPQGPTDGDFNFDGVVNSDDLDAWTAQFGDQPPTTAANVIVAEPSSGIAALIALAGLLVRSGAFAKADSKAQNPK